MSTVVAETRGKTPRLPTDLASLGRLRSSRRGLRSTLVDVRGLVDSFQGNANER